MRKKRYLVWLVLWLMVGGVGPVQAQGPEPMLVKDISPGQGNSRPQYLTNVNGTLFFEANDGVSGAELWKSNGTAAGTVLVKDIRSGAGHSFIQNLTHVNGTLFFEADDGINSNNLWKSDGTAAGTVLVKNVELGTAAMVNVNGTLFFSADDGVNGYELWKSDGTTAGTVMVKDIDPNPGDGSFPEKLTNVNGTLFFSADDGINGRELWKSDGTTAGTVLVKNINPGSGSSSPSNLTNVNGTLFFAASDGINGHELWKSDGTAVGTVLVKDIFPGNVSSFISNLTNVNGTLFFRAIDGVNGHELWKSDGTATGTIIVKDISPGQFSSSSPSNLTNVNGTLFFNADDGASGDELWKSDGTATGTIMVKDILPGNLSSSPRDLINVNGTLFFEARADLWKSDGTAVGTTMVKDTSICCVSTPPQPVNVNGALYFRARDETNGEELWKLATGPGLDGSNIISGRVTDINGMPLAGVAISVGSSQITTTDSNGYYTLNYVINGEHTITASKSGYSFSPSFRLVSVPPNAGGQNFTGSADPRLVVDPGKLRFQTVVGNNPNPQNFTISNGGSGGLTWSAAESISWLSLNQSSGAAPSTVIASVNSGGLSIGRHSGQITLTSPQAVNSPLLLDVDLIVGCNPRNPVDVALAVDVSGSMFGTPLQDAKNAANGFVDLLDFNQDQVSLVSFNSGAFLQHTLTQGEIAVQTTITNLSAGGLTDIAEAIQVAHVELNSVRHDPNNHPVIVLFSDGMQTVSGNPIAAAEAAKADGIYIITIGSGNADTATLQAMASSPADYYYTPNSAELADIYEQIYVTVGCPSLLVNPLILNFPISQPGQSIPAQTFTIDHSLNDPLNWSLIESIPWLSISASNGTTPATLTATADPNKLDQGSPAGTIVVTSPQAQNSPQEIQVRLVHQVFVPVIMK